MAKQSKHVGRAVCGGTESPTEDSVMSSMEKVHVSTCATSRHARQTSHGPRGEACTMVKPAHDIVVQHTHTEARRDITQPARNISRHPSLLGVVHQLLQLGHHDPCRTAGGLVPVAVAVAVGSAALRLGSVAAETQGLRCIHIRLRQSTRARELRHRQAARTILEALEIKRGVAYGGRHV